MYRKKPKTVEAWKISDVDNQPDWVANAERISGEVFRVTTDNDGLAFAVVYHDYIIRESNGLFSIIPASIFEDEYELIDEA